MQSLLRSDDVGQHTLNMTLPENNPQAMQELREYLELAARSSHKVVMHDLINDRFAKRPYGWPPMEIVLLLTRLYTAGEIHFLTSDTPVPRERLYELIATASKWRGIKLIRRVTANPEDLRKARELGHTIFGEMGPDSEDGLHAFLQRKLEGWQEDLTGFKALAETGDYPGDADIQEGLGLVRQLLAPTESYKFLQRLDEKRADLPEFADSYHDLKHFYGPQRPTWDKLRKAYDRFTRNRLELDRDEQASSALRRMHEILTAPAPYGLIKEANGLIHTVSEVNDKLVSDRRAAALAAVEAQLTLVKANLTAAGGDTSSRPHACDRWSNCETWRRSKTASRIWPRPKPRPFDLRIAPARPFAST